MSLNVPAPLLAPGPGILYKAKSGDRWDLLAWDAYGNPFWYEQIIHANPYSAIEPVLEAGVPLIVPVIVAGNVTAENLPPWKDA
jgi:phage tail protein X